jgi:AraC-like DNA-binding protein
MDALSEALSAVRMNAAIFYNAEYSAPWGDMSPAAHEVAHELSPCGGHLVIFHLVIEGRASVRIPGMEDMQLEAGDIVIVPHGDEHLLFNGKPAELIKGANAVRRYLAGDIGITRAGGGGEATRFVCGYFSGEPQAARLFLSGLPPMIKINVRGDAAGAWLESSIRHLVCESASDRPGRNILLAKMAEALFVEALRRYARDLPEGETGWLAGARDPLVGAALAAIHRKPNRHWTLPELASEAGTSRSVLSDRFHHFLGESPMAYLSRWRMQLAARLITADRKPMIQVAMDVGYESEAAFNRAFKREFGLPPAQYRRSIAQRPASA